ncbi:MAG TPA: LysR substrate-binding domain-containing protein [Polyangiaceae bacterium]|nr:LysR substrate-binding domain-containing protein [Polyangiaceae bacterium]
MDTIDGVELGSLRVFEAVVAHGGFAAAGRRLGLSRAAVSRVARQLEAQIGVRLFRRTTRRVALTDAAQRLAADLARCLPALRTGLELAAAERKPSGLVRVSVSRAFGRHYVLPSVARFVAAHPAVRVDVQLNDRVDDLVGEPIDVAVRMGPLPPSSLIARRLARLPAVVVASPALLDAARPRPRRPPATSPLLPLAALAEVPAAAFRIPGTDDIVPWSVAHGGRLHVVAPSRVVARSDAIEGVADLARLGVGAAFVPRYLVEDDLATGRLVVLADGAPSAGPEVHLCFLHRELQPLRVQTIIAHLSDDLRRALSR